MTLVYSILISSHNFGQSNASSILIGGDQNETKRRLTWKSELKLWRGGPGNTKTPLTYRGGLLVHALRAEQSRAEQSRGGSAESRAEQSRAPSVRESLRSCLLKLPSFGIRLPNSSMPRAFGQVIDVGVASFDFATLHGVGRNFKPSLASLVVGERKKHCTCFAGTVFKLNINTMLI